MKALQKRVANLEQVKGEEGFYTLSVYHTADGRIRHDGQLYADTEALLNAQDITQGTVQFIHWRFDIAPAEKICPCDESQLEAGRRKEKAEPVKRVECSSAAVCNPFMRPVTPEMIPRQTYADAPTTVFGPDGILKHYNDVYPYRR